MDLTLKEAGEKLGLSDKGIGAIEDGRVSLKRKRIVEFVTLYGLDYLDFIRVKKLIEKSKGKSKRGKGKQLKRFSVIQTEEAIKN